MRELSAVVLLYMAGYGIFLMLAPGTASNVGLSASYRTPSWLGASQRRVQRGRILGIWLTTFSLGAGSMAALEMSPLSLRISGTISGLGALGMAAAAIMAKVRGAKAEDPADLPENEPSELAYELQTLVFIISACVWAIFAVVVWT